VRRNWSLPARLRPPRWPLPLSCARNGSPRRRPRRARVRFLRRAPQRRARFEQAPVEAALGLRHRLGVVNAGRQVDREQRLERRISSSGELGAASRWRCRAGWRASTTRRRDAGGASTVQPPRGGSSAPRRCGRGRASRRAIRSASTVAALSGSARPTAIHRLAVEVARDAKPARPRARGRVEQRRAGMERQLVERAACRDDAWARGRLASAKRRQSSALRAGFVERSSAAGDRKRTRLTEQGPRAASAGLTACAPAACEVGRASRARRRRSLVVAGARVAERWRATARQQALPAAGRQGQQRETAVAAGAGRSRVAVSMLRVRRFPSTSAAQIPSARVAAARLLTSSGSADPERRLDRHASCRICRERSCPPWPVVRSRFRRPSSTCSSL
jgi:hypothetical protein